MQALINDLLNFSRHSTSPSDFKETDLNLLIKDAIGELELEIERTNTKIHVEDMPVVSAIPSLMRQLFYNLLSNAIKFRKKTVAPVVHINAERLHPSGPGPQSKTNNKKDFFKIAVSDNGIGFDPKHADDIFMIFKRLHSYHEFEGTGVGLSICKKIIEKHNGSITAQSKIDQGSTFLISLPERQP
jgi:light-regulated signal transduction histidine kinase (bacteriophytochrome)